MNVNGKAAGGVLCALALCFSGWVTADVEVTAPDGRRVLLKDDKTWQYVEPAAPKAAANEPVERKSEAAGGKSAELKTTGADANASADAKQPEQKKETGEALLQLVEKTEGNRVCRMRLRLVNNLTYEIRSLVPEFSVYRPNGVVYDSVLSGFAFIKPGDSQMREVRFNGIDCQDIARVQVGGGDRCEMGELDKFSTVRGQCLARVRVEGSSIVRFDK